MKKKTVALIGASGYLGLKLLAVLQNHPQVSKIICLDTRKPPEHFLSERVVFYLKDIRDKEVCEIFCRHNVDTVFHLAFVVNPIRNRREMYSINVEGTKNVLTAVKACDARHLLIASSASAFGAFPDNPPLLTENMPLRKHSFCYASDKYEVEMLVRDFKTTTLQLKVAVIRPCIIYGPNVSNYLSRFLLNLPALLQIRGNRPEMQFVHEDDVASFFLLVFDREADGYFHVAGEGTISTEEVAQIADRKIFALPSWLAYPLVDILYKLHFPLIEAPAPMLDFIRYRWVISTQQSCQKLNFTPKYTSADVIRSLCNISRMQST